MVSTGNDRELTVINGVNKTVCFVDSSGPEPTEILLQRLGLAETVKGVSLCIEDQFVDASQCSSVLSLPKHVVRPRRSGPGNDLNHL